MANTLENLAALIHLPQFALRIRLVLTMNQEVINDQADPGADTKSIFRNNRRQHEDIPYISMRSIEYM